MTAAERDPAHPADRRTAWDRYWSEVGRSSRQEPGRFTRWALGWLREAGVKSVLDLGCGPGRDLTFLIDQGFAVTGVDDSPVAIRLAEEAVHRRPPAVSVRARLVLAGALEFLVRSAACSFDAVHAADTYQGLSEADLDRLFAEVYRVLRPGGVHLWLARSSRHPGRKDPGSVAPNLPGLGFTVPLRFLDRHEIERLTSGRFETLHLEEVGEPPAWYVAGRTLGPPVDRG